jgi:hypothetical protein
MLGGVDFGRPQIAHQQLLATNNRAAESSGGRSRPEKALFLAPMHRHVAGVEIENDFRAAPRVTQ